MDKFPAYTHEKPMDDSEHNNFPVLLVPVGSPGKQRVECCVVASYFSVSRFTPPHASYSDNIFFRVELMSLFRIGCLTLSRHPLGSTNSLDLTAPPN